MNDFERGRDAAQTTMTNLSTQTFAFRQGYRTGMAKAANISLLLITALDMKGVDDEPDDEGYQYGLDAALETVRQLDERSKEYRAGWLFELKRPLDEHERIVSREGLVARRAQSLFQDHKTLEAHVSYKMAMLRDPDQRTVSAPLTPNLDARERAYIKALTEARDLKHRVDAKVQAHHMAKGDAEFVIETKDGSTISADPALIAAKIREVRADIHSA